MAKNRIFSNTDPEQLIKELLLELQGLDRRMKNLKKAAQDAEKHSVMSPKEIWILEPSEIKAKDLRELNFDSQAKIQMLRSAIQSAKEQLSTVDKDRVKMMKAYTKIEKEFEPDKIITGHSPISGAAGHERYAAIMDTLSKKERDERRHGMEPGSMNDKGYDSATFFDLYELAVEYGKTIPEVEEMVKNGQIEGLTFE